MKVATGGLLLYLFDVFIPVVCGVGLLVGDLGLREVVELDRGGTCDIFRFLGGFANALTHVVIFYLLYHSNYRF